MALCVLEHPVGVNVIKSFYFNVLTVLVFGTQNPPRPGRTGALDVLCFLRLPDYVIGAWNREVRGRAGIAQLSTDAKSAAPAQRLANFGQKGP